ncbi:hypothetical protein [Acidiphilium sp. C61]|uniref:hypothetical protein n=1 Tax=Acidiphilium sp. C61 TaxID=1671485 RepID=UPI00157B314F|nr:hypothetical protein [Acidiphilium sp. C61]
MSARARKTGGLVLGILRVEGAPAQTRYELFPDEQGLIRWRRAMLRRNWREWVAPAIDSAIAEGQLHDVRLLISDPEMLTDRQVDEVPLLYKIAVTFEAIPNMTVVRDGPVAVRDQLSLFGDESEAAEADPLMAGPSP